MAVTVQLSGGLSPLKRPASEVMSACAPALCRPDAVIATDKEDLVKRVNEITDGKAVGDALPSPSCNTQLIQQCLL